MTLLACVLVISVFIMVGWALEKVNNDPLSDDFWDSMFGPIPFGILGVVLVAMYLVSR